MFRLPVHSPRKYASATRCIYCGSTNNLTEEHIVPLGLGGRWTLPNGSCQACAKITSAFEGTCLRTMLGPLRMYYGMPSRRRGKRPKKLPLKVKLKPESDWSYIDVEQEIYPFLILFPLLHLPDELSGQTTYGEREAKVRQLWIRAASFRYGIMPHLNSLAARLHVAAIEPTGTFKAPEFFRMLAKIAHAFAIAELGENAFVPFVGSIICKGETSNSVQFIGGSKETEHATSALHEVSFWSIPSAPPETVAVRVRLLSALETPTYYVAVGRKSADSNSM